MIHFPRIVEASLVHRYQPDVYASSEAIANLFAHLPNARVVIFGANSHIIASVRCLIQRYEG